MNQEINLRRATLDDIDKFLAVENTVVDRKIFSILPGEEEKKDVAESIANNFVYFIEKSNKIVGTIAYEFINNHATLFGMVVLPEFQRQGMARRAIKILLEELKDVKMVDLVTHPENEKAINLYESLGFKKTGEQIENHFGDGEPRIRMVFEK